MINQKRRTCIKRVNASKVIISRLMLVCRSHSSWLLPASGFSAKTRPLQKPILNTHHQTVIILDLNSTIGGWFGSLFRRKLITGVRCWLDVYENVFGNSQQCYGLNISCTPPTLYLTLIRLICLCLCLFMSVPMSVFVCVCFQSDECGVHNCISNTHRAHESPVTIYGHFPLSPLTEGPSQSKN